MRRPLSLLLALALTFALTPSPAFADVASETSAAPGDALAATPPDADGAQGTTDRDGAPFDAATAEGPSAAPLVGDAPGSLPETAGALTVTDSDVNPEYADLPDSGRAGARSTLEDGDEAGADLLPLYPQFTSFGDAAEYVRACMIDRKPQVTLRYQATSSYDPKETYHQLLDSAMLEYASSTVAGDYLLRHYSGSQSSMSGSGSSWSFCIDIKYHTSAAEEAATTSAVESLLGQLDVWHASDFAKVMAVHDWMAMNISYDDDYAGRTDYSPYSAYSAIVKRNTVCQGFGSLFYRLCKELGVNARYVSGRGLDESHGWNIVCVDGWWYNIDVTWDQNTGNNQWVSTQFFLKSNAEFPDHVRDAEFDTALFNQRYPMSPTSYDPSTPTTESIAGASVSGVQGSYLYTGSPIEPSVTVTLNGTTLSPGVDYAVSYRNNVACGTATVVIDGTGNYHGTVERTFRIEWTPECELFLDTPAGSWYIEQGALGYVVDAGIMSGYGGDRYGEFGPDDPITRGQVAVILHRLAGEPYVAGDGGFSDVAAGMYYTEAIAWAKKLGVVDGYPDGRFGPDDPVQREQFVKMLGAYAELCLGMDVSSDCRAAASINEWDRVSSWARASLGWAVDNKIMGGVEVDGSCYLQPQAGATRAQAAKMFMVFDRDVADGSAASEPEPEPEPDPEPEPTAPVAFSEDGYTGVVMAGTEGYEEGDIVDLDASSEPFAYYGPGALEAWLAASGHEGAVTPQGA